LSTETEIKVRIDSPDSFCRKLDVFNPKVLSGRHFEDNYLLDFPDGRLRSNQCLVRIRYAEGQSIITYKGPPRAEGIFKTREELETRLENGVIAYRILEQLGLCLWFRYQKYRQEFQLDEVVVSVDETPAGNYAEFEGSEERIETLARKMGIDRSQFIRSSYYALFMEQCQKRGITAGHMIF
jgi:predicted adenylyl cyclase CyaB